MMVNMAAEDVVYYGEDHVGRRRHITIDDPDDEDDGSCTSSCRKCCTCFKSVVLTLLIFLGFLTGIGVGVVLRFLPPFDKPNQNTREMMYFYYPVELYSRLLTFLTVPLIISSLISGAGSLSPCASVKVGLRTLAYYVCTSILAVGEGLGFLYAIRPGAGEVGQKLITYIEGEKAAREPVVIRVDNTVDHVLDMFRNVVPDGLMSSLLYMERTNVSLVEINSKSDAKISVESFSPIREAAINLPGLMFFAIIFGLALAKMGERGRLTHWFCEVVSEAILTIVRASLWVFPFVAIFAMAHAVISLDDPVSQMNQLFLFALTVIMGLCTHMFLILPIIYVIFTRRNPFRHLYHVFRAMLFGFTTDSSIMALPVTMDCLEKAGVNPRIVRWVCPIGATINTDGFALYEAMACVFIAMMRGVPLSALQITILGFMTVALSLVAPRTGGNLTIYVALFNMLGLPVQDIFLLMPFDWMMTRFRTVINIWSDCIGAGIVDKCSKADLVDDHEPEIENRNCVNYDHSADGAVLTRYTQRKDWTVRLINPYGDRMVVSKV